MPRAKSVCYRRGCTKPTVRNGRCDLHAPPPEKPWTRTSARNLGRPSKWDRVIRPRALARDGFACLSCGARDGLQVDHVVPIAHGGLWELENAQTLCESCHGQKTQADRLKYRKR